MIGSHLVTPQTTRYGELVEKILIETGHATVRELYLAALIDPVRQTPVLIGSAVGGAVVREIDLAERLGASDAEVVQVPMQSDGSVSDECVKKLADAMAIEPQARDAFANIARSIAAMLVTRDATLVEINPLAILEDGELICLDCKMSLDANALHRQTWVEEFDDAANTRRARSVEGFNFQRLDGDIGCVVTGAGLALATMDILGDCGHAPANFLDLPPGASVDDVRAALSHVISSCNPKLLLINAIAGGFTHLDTIARGLIAERELLDSRPLVVRFAGAGQSHALKLIENAGLNVHVARTLADIGPTLDHLAGDTP